ncbi:hypothetical protein GCM10020220_051460 [Nonomuraea rubra]
MYVGRSLTAAYRTGTWRLDQPGDPCEQPLGRRGQNERMVPEGAVNVLVCRARSNRKADPRAEHGAREAAELASALRHAGHQAEHERLPAGRARDRHVPADFR